MDIVWGATKQPSADESDCPIEQALVMTEFSATDVRQVWSGVQGLLLQMSRMELAI
jgi:hypothetical protein